MTVKEIFDSARALLGYSLSEDCSAEYPFEVNALFFFNCIYFELTGNTLGSEEEAVEASPAVLDALPYGIAMLLSLYAGDTAKQNFLADIFGAKRAKCRASLSKIKDVLPRC